MNRLILIAAMLLALGACKPVPEGSHLAGDLDEAEWQRLTVAVDAAADRAGTAGDKLETLLAAARQVGNLNVAQAPDGSGLLIHQAARLGDSTLISELIALEAIPGARTTGDGLTALHISAQGGCVECLDVLLTAGVAVDLPARDGRRAIEMAAAAGQDAAVANLLGAGAAPLVEPELGELEESVGETDLEESVGEMSRG